MLQGTTLRRVCVYLYSLLQVYNVIRISKWKHLEQQYMWSL